MRASFDVLAAGIVAKKRTKFLRSAHTSGEIISEEKRRRRCSDGRRWCPPVAAIGRSRLILLQKGIATLSKNVTHPPHTRRSGLVVAVMDS